jgi:ribosomal protein S18 acetylase RimI-like enzyme
MTAVVRSGRRTLAVAESMDRERLRSFLERDRVFAAYALCDLDDREFSRTRWGLALHDGEPVALGLEYAGLSPQPVFVMGDDDGISAILGRVVRPRVAYVAALVESLSAVEVHYRVDPGPPMVRMWVDRTTFAPYPADLQRLYPADAADLNRLYQLGFTSWLPSSSVAEGVYYGIRVGGRLVGAAGTHVVSRQARIGVVGNVMTAPEYRGRGYAKATTGAVTAELLRSCDLVVLNVRADNPPALAAYRALGYSEHVRFEERLIHRLESPWPGLLARIRGLFTSPREEPR